MQPNQFWPQWMKLKFDSEANKAVSGLRDLGGPLNLSTNQGSVVSNSFLVSKSKNSMLTQNFKIRHRRLKFLENCFLRPQEKIMSPCHVQLNLQLWLARFTKLSEIETQTFTKSKIMFRHTKFLEHKYFNKKNI